MLFWWGGEAALTDACGDGDGLSLVGDLFLASFGTFACPNPTVHVCII